MTCSRDFATGQNLVTCRCPLARKIASDLQLIMFAWYRRPRQRRRPLVNIESNDTNRLILDDGKIVIDQTIATHKRALERVAIDVDDQRTDFRQRAIHDWMEPV